MAVMEISIFPLDTEERPVMGDFVTFFILLSKEKGIKCQLTSPSRAIIEGGKKTLLEILDEFDSNSFSKVTKAASLL